MCEILPGRNGNLIYYTIWVFMFQGSLGSTFEDMYRLKYDLFQVANYSNMVRPKLNQSEVTEIHLKMVLGMLIQLDTKEQVMKTSGWFYISWVDEKLRWNPEDYGGIEEINVLQKDIWLPDFIATNSIRGYELFGEDNLRLYINSTGRVIWEPGFAFTTACNMDVTMFPVDKQICAITVVPWMTNTKQIHVKTLGLDVTRLLSPNYQFDIINSTSRLGENVFSGNQYTVLQDIIFEIHLKRKALFYQLNAIAPIAVLSLLCCVSFLVSPESGEKLTVSITTLLSITVFLGVVDENLPKTSRSISYFVIYVSTLIGMSFLGVVLNAAIMYLYNLNPPTKVPAISKSLLVKNKEKTLPASDGGNNNDSNDNLDQSMLEMKGNHWHIITRKLGMICFVIFITLLSFINTALAFLLHE